MLIVNLKTAGWEWVSIRIEHNTILGGTIYIVFYGVVQQDCWREKRQEKTNLPYEMSKQPNFRAHLRNLILRQTPINLTIGIRMHSR